MSAQAAVQTAPDLTSPKRQLPLENGDHLTRAEFERRYEAMAQIKKAELIEGVVYMPSPVRNRSHSEPHAQIMTWLGVYCANTPYVRLGDNATVRLDLDNEVQPDALLRLEPEHGGRSRPTDDDYLEGAPELIVEIAASSASYDLREKLSVYRRNQVQEYLVWRVYDRALDWFAWTGGEFVALAPGPDKRIESRVFPGLTLDVDALLAGELAKVLKVLNEGLTTDVHAQFVRRLSTQGEA